MLLGVLSVDESCIESLNDATLVAPLLRLIDDERDDTAASLEYATRLLAALAAIGASNRTVIVNAGMSTVARCLSDGAAPQVQLNALTLLGRLNNVDATTAGDVFKSIVGIIESPYARLQQLALHELASRSGAAASARSAFIDGGYAALVRLLSSGEHVDLHDEAAALWLRLLRDRRLANDLVGWVIFRGGGGLVEFCGTICGTAPSNSKDFRIFKK